MNKIQTLLTTTVLLFGMSGSSVADFDDGWVASEKGDYKKALNEWKPLAEQGDARAQYNLASLCCVIKRLSNGITSLLNKVISMLNIIWH